jgi:hypothetical protein
LEWPSIRLYQTRAWISSKILVVKPRDISEVKPDFFVIRNGKFREWEGLRLASFARSGKDEERVFTGVRSLTGHRDRGTVRIKSRWGRERDEVRQGKGQDAPWFHAEFQRPDNRIPGEGALRRLDIDPAGAGEGAVRVVRNGDHRRE